MSKKDKTQAQIAWLQLVFALGVTAMFAIIGWLATATSIKSIMIILASIALAGLILGLAFLSTLVNDKINELEEL